MNVCSASMCSDPVKVAVVLHSGPNTVKKAWRFNCLDTRLYTLASIETELIQLFPEVQEKGLGLRLSYQDDIIGTINIEGDSDLQTALESFSEQWNAEGQLKHLTFNVTERIIPFLKRQHDERFDLFHCQVQPPSIAEDQDEYIVERIVQRYLTAN